MIRKAQDFGINEPLDPQCWADDSESGLSPEDIAGRLTWAGQAKLRAQIRELQKKNWQFWITVITALTGLAGTGTALVLALEK